MLIETHGGFDFTRADCMGWMRDVGFTQTRVESLFREVTPLKSHAAPAPVTPEQLKELSIKLDKID